MLDVVAFFLTEVVFIRTVVDKHCNGGLCLVRYYVVFLRAVVDKHYCGGLFCLIW